MTPDDAPHGSGRRRLDPQVRRAQILDAARRLAAGRDLSQVSTAQVAEAAGVSQGLLFRYFPTRRDLELAVVRQATDALLAALRTTPTGPPADRLRAGLVTYLDHVESEPESWRVLLRPRDDDDVARVLAELDEQNLALLLETLGTEPALAPAALLTAVRAWLALEQRACLLWSGQSSRARAAGRPMLTGLLVETFFAALGAAAAVDDETARLVAPLLPGAGEPPDDPGPPEPQEPAAGPARSGRSDVLVVVDMQNGFVRPASAHVVPVIDGLVQEWLDAGRDVVLTRYVNHPGSPHERLTGWTGMRDAPETDLVDPLRRHAGRAVAVLDKDIYSLFTPAGARLVRDRGWTDLYLCGIATEGCVLKTAVDAFERGLSPWVLTDAVASHAGEQAHQAGLLVAGRYIGRQRLIPAVAAPR